MNYGDFQMDENGDLVLDANGDYAIVFGDEWLAQEALFRMKTVRGDWLLAPDVGCSLESFIGQPNTDETHRAIEATVERALSIEGLFITPTIQAAPIGEDVVFILVEFPSIEDEERVIQIQSSVDLKKGTVFSRSGFRNI